MSARRRPYPRRSAGPSVAARRVVPLRRGPHPADAHRRRDDVRRARRLRLRRVRRADRAAARAGAALAAEGARGARPPRPAGVGRRRRLRPRVPRAPLGPARPGHRGAAARAGGAAARAAAGPLPAAVGDLPGRGAGRRPVRGGHEDPPRDGRRARLDGRRGAAARLTPEPRETPPDEWRPPPEPSALELAADAVREARRGPRTVLDVAARAARGRPRGDGRRSSARWRRCVRGPGATRCTRSTP